MKPYKQLTSEQRYQISGLKSKVDPIVQTIFRLQ